MMVKTKRKNKFPRGYWNIKENRIKAISNLSKRLNKRVELLTQRDFRKNELSGLITKYKGNVEKLLKDSGYDIKIKVVCSEKRKPLPIGYWDVREHRVQAVRELITKLNKPPSHITYMDFEKYQISYLLKKKYYGSINDTLKDAGFDVEHHYKNRKKNVPDGYWNIKKNRIQAVKRFIKKLNKSPYDITSEDFKNNGLNAILAKYQSYYDVLKEAGFDKGTPRKKRGYWDVKENRIKAVQELSEKLSKSQLELTYKDMIKNGLSGMISKYKHIQDMRKDLGYDIMIGIGKNKMIKRVPNHYWKKKENRVKAVKELVQILNKDPNKISKKDFKENGLETILYQYTNEKCKDYSMGDIIPYNEGYLLKYDTRHKRALAEAGYIIK